MVGSGVDGDVLSLIDLPPNVALGAGGSREKDTAREGSRSFGDSALLGGRVGILAWGREAGPSGDSRAGGGCYPGSGGGCSKAVVGSVVTAMELTKYPCRYWLGRKRELRT